MPAQKIDFAQVRQNMVDSQLHPMGVVSEQILAAFASVPRERFVPESKAGIAYCDEDIAIGEGRYLMEPSIIGRLMEFAELKPQDVALSIGAGAAYTAALLSTLIENVIALEESHDYLAQAQAVWDQNAYRNIFGMVGPLREGAKNQAPFTLVIINGCVASIPHGLKQQLAEGGRLLTVIKPQSSGVAKAVLVTRELQDTFSERILFDAHTPYLKGFEPLETFVF